MILIDNTPPTQLAGSDAAEIGRMLIEVFVALQAMPGMKWMGDRVYEQVAITAIL